MRLNLLNVKKQKVGKSMKLRLNFIHENQIAENPTKGPSYLSYAATPLQGFKVFVDENGGLINHL